MHAMRQRSDDKLGWRSSVRVQELNDHSCGWAQVPRVGSGTHGGGHKRCPLAKRAGQRCMRCDRGTTTEPATREERWQAQAVPASQEGWPEMHAMRQRKDYRHKR